MKNFFLKQRSFLNGTVLEYLLVSVFFIVLTFMFTAWVVLNISGSLFIEAAGDGTSGFLWLAWADTDLNPIPGFTDLVNYPDGVQLGNPVIITYAAIWLPLWLLSRLFNPVAALNLVTMWGFFAAAMATYWLLKRLTSSVWVSLFAGFAVAFVPYHIVKSSSHLAYIFSLVFVLILAGFIGLWRRPTFWRAIIFAATIALAFYTDGYYILLSSVFVATLIGGGIVYELISKSGAFWKRIWQRVKYFLLATGAVVLLVLPIAFVQIKYGGEVGSNLAQARGDIGHELYFYAAKPYDYVIPAMRHPLLEKNPQFEQIQQFKNVRSNPSESTLYLGWIVILLATIGFCLIAAYFIVRKNQSLNMLSDNSRKMFLLVASLTFIAVPVLFAFSLSPQIGIAGLKIPLPGQLLILFDISFWRVLARFFLPLHVILSVFAAFSLWVLLTTYRSYVKQEPDTRQLIQLAVCATLMGLMALEYATLTNRPPFSFSSIPPAYTWLKQQNDVNAVVEFPFVGRPWDTAVNAVTAQIVHGKKLLNLHLSKQTPGQRNAFVGIDNPEAIDFAVRRGATIGVTVGEPCTKKYTWLELAYDGSKDKGYTLICMYYLKSVSSDDLFANLKAGFLDVPHVTKDGDFYNTLYGNYAEVWAMGSDDKFITVPTNAIFKTTLVGTPLKPEFTGTWQLLQDEKQIIAGDIVNSEPVAIEAQIDASKPIQLRFMGADGQSPEVGQLSLQDISITEL
ncbi:MAG TPA: hypothetical protein VLA77_00960 [Candidatus Saccharimonadales bacterium]|nr:hypothetical protein [Candidatus Saccharimonadales bacterium]